MVLKDIWGVADREVERIALWMADALIEAAERDAAAAAPARRRAKRASTNNENAQAKPRQLAGSRAASRTSR